ncbi:MAG: DUF448 domain-containing protein [Myxococcota bacterium]
MSAVRQSVVSKRREDRSGLLRLTLDPEGQPFVDVLGVAPGRGVWVAPGELREALSPKGLDRAFRGKARKPGPEAVEALLADAAARLEQRLLELAGLARRAGALTYGMDAVLGEIEVARDGLVVLTASDLSERSTAKVEEAVRRHEGVKWVRGPTIERIGRAIGRDTVGIIAVAHRSLGPAVWAEANRIAALSGAVRGERGED